MTSYLQKVTWKPSSAYTFFSRLYPPIFYFFLFNSSSFWWLFNNNLSKSQMMTQFFQFVRHGNQSTFFSTNWELKQVFLFYFGPIPDVQIDQG